MAELPFAIGSDIGVVREQNQDRVAVLRASINASGPYTIVAVCDGMGGMEAGEICAATAIGAFFSSCIENAHVPVAQRLSLAAKEANDLVYKQYRQKGGSTLSALIIDDQRNITGINVGDSRIYSFGCRGLTQLTVDDTIAGQLHQDKEVSEQHKELVQFVGMGPEIEPHIIQIDVSEQMLCLATDGLHCIGKNAMQLLLQSANEPVVAAKRMVDVAKWFGGRDNISVAIVTSLAPQRGASVLSNVVEIWDSFGDFQVVPFVEGSAEVQVSTLKDPFQKTPPEQKKDTTTKNKRNQRKKPREPELFNPAARQIVVDQVPKLSVSFEDSNKEGKMNEKPSC